MESVLKTTGSVALQLMKAEENYYGALRSEETELACVGAALGGGFGNTAELKVVNYQQAMASDDKAMWQKAVDEEYKRMIDNKVFKVVPRSRY